MTRRAILFGPLPPPAGGVAVFVSRLRPHVLERGGEVWAYSGGRGVPGAVHLDHRRLGHIRRLLTQGRNARITDSTHFNLEYPHWLLAPLWIALKHLLGFTWIKVLHDGTLPDRSREFRGVRASLFRWSLRSVDEFVPVSEELAEWLRDEARVRAPTRAVPALLPLSDAEIVNSHLSDAVAAAELEKARRHEYLVCSVGIFSPEYGFDQIANAVESVRERSGRDLGLLLVDGGLSADPDYLASVLLDRDWIHMVSNVPFDEMQAVYKRSDLFVRGFAKEGYGLARIEALWSGVPVIASIATEERGMFRYRFGDVEGLTSLIESVLSGSRVSEAAEWSAKFGSDAERYLAAHLASIFGPDA